MSPCDALREIGGIPRASWLCFFEQLERKYGVQLHAKPLGRPRKPPQAEAALTASAVMSA